MATLRKKFRLAAAEHQKQSLLPYEQEILDAINRTIAGKNPKVFEHYISIDPLTHSETIRICRELSKIADLVPLGKKIETFRLFEGKLYESEDSDKPILNSKSNNKQEINSIRNGGRMR
ncbi:MAG: hypothetical protein IKT39_02990 [Clostridia bacterium]|nr:hypothetical protein [Clostridia bacterium]